MTMNRLPDTGMRPVTGTRATSGTGARALPTLACTALAVACALHAGISAADDTEVYFGKPSATIDTKPNVLFVLDTSGSMGSRDGGSTTRLDRMKDAVKDMIRQADDLNVGLMKFHSYKGGPVLFPVTDVDGQTCTGELCGGVTTSSSIASETDDVEEYVGKETTTYETIPGKDKDKDKGKGKDKGKDKGKGKGDTRVEIVTTEFEGEVRTDGNILELAHDRTRGEEMIGLRFADLQIPRGATIVEAHLDLMASHTNSGDPVRLDVQIEDTGDAATFSSTDHAVSGRPWHDSKVTWTLGNWTKGEVYSSVDIGSLVGEITKKSDWCGGNAVALRLKKDAASTTTDIRQALTFDNVSAQAAAAMTATAGGGAAATVGQAPTLRVKYTADALPAGGGCMRTSTAHKVAHGKDDAEEYLDRDKNDMLLDGIVLDMPYAGNSEQEVGIRFNKVDVPRGVTVRRAWIEFEVAGAKSGDAAADVSVLIRGQRDNPVKRFGWGKNNITNRNETTASVIWKDVPNAAANETVRTEDVSAIVRELTGRTTWSANDPMAFLFTHHSGSGTRGFKTYENSKSGAARLIVEYDDETASDGTGVTTRPLVARDELINLVDSLVATGYTPIVDTLWEASLYYRGAPVDWGKTRGPENHEYHRVSHPESYTGSDSVYRAEGCTDDNLNASACRSEAILGDAVYKSPIANSCQTNHIVLLSDGDANGNHSAGKIRQLTGVSRCETNSGSEACGYELAEWLHDSDLSDAITNRQNVKTHTIAFNLDDPTFLRKLAQKGGGSMYKASNSADLLKAFRSIIDNVSAIDTSFTAPGATVNQFNRLTHRDDIYFAMFKPSDEPRWSGNLKRFRIGSADGDADSEVEIRDRNDDPAIDETTGFFSEDAFSFWPEKKGNTVVTTPDGHDVQRGGAANQMALTGLSVGSRRTYTWVGAAKSVPEGGVDLTADEQELDEDNDALTTSLLGIDGVGDNDEERAEYRTSLLKWARGVDVHNEDGDERNDDSRHHMGDPMHSRPVILNYADATVAKDGVRSIVFVATNEGYVHAIDAENGQERYAFMPSELLGNLNTQFENNSLDDHLYGLDGPLSLWREDTSGNKNVIDPGDKAYLFFGMRRGGSNYYALDVSSLDSPKLAWAIQGGDDPSEGFAELGQTWSRMTPVSMKINNVTEDVLVFGGGYDTEQDDAQIATGTTPQKGRGLYIVRATTGERLWSGLGTTGGTQTFADMKYPIPGSVRAIDLNRNGLVDQIYAADTGGQLWRFDVDEQHAGSDDELMQGGVIADFSGTDADSHRRFYTEPDVALIEQEGKRFLTIGIGSGWRAHPLRTEVEDRFYVVRQNDVGKVPDEDAYGFEKEDGTYRPIVDSDLVEVGDTMDPAIGNHGWYLDLKRTGEKVLGTSITFDNSVIFSSYVPQAVTGDCSTGLGGGRAYVLDVVSGAPKRDLDEDGDFDLDDESVPLKHGGLPPDAMIMITEDSGDEPEILFGGEKLDGAIRNVTRRTFWSDRGKPKPIVQASSEDDELDVEEELQPPSLPQ